MKDHFLKLTAFALLQALAVCSHEVPASEAKALRGAAIVGLRNAEEAPEVLPYEDEILLENLPEEETEAVAVGEDWWQNRNSQGRNRNSRGYRKGRGNRACRRTRSAGRNARKNFRKNGYGNRRSGGTRGRTKRGGKYKANWNRKSAHIRGKTRNGYKYNGSFDRSKGRRARRDFNKYGPCREGEEEVWIYDEDEDYDGDYDEDYDEDSLDESEDSEDEDSEDEDEDSEDEDTKAGGDSTESKEKKVAASVALE